MSCDGRKRKKERDRRMRRRRREREREGGRERGREARCASLSTNSLYIFHFIYFCPYFYLLQIILGVYKTFQTQPSLVDIAIPEVRVYDNPVFSLVCFGVWSQYLFNSISQYGFEGLNGYVCALVPRKLVHVHMYN